VKFSEFRKTSEEGKANKVDRFIGECLMSVTYMHSAHFGVSGAGSYSKHKALEEFYLEMQELVDTFTETNIGITGRYQPTLVVRKEINEVAYLQELTQMASEIYNDVDSSLQSILDDIKVLCFKTIYKLTKLA